MMEKDGLVIYKNKAEYNKAQCKLFLTYFVMPLGCSLFGFIAGLSLSLI